MHKQCLILVVAMSIHFSVANATPPHPEVLQEILNGQMPKPIFMADPTYKARMGIDRGFPQPLFEPGTRLTNPKFLAVLVGFSDQPGVTSAAFFDSMVFGTNPGPWGPTLRDFYKRASYGNLTIVTVNFPSSAGWLTSTNTRAYYTTQGGQLSYGMGTHPNNSQGLCEWVVNAIDPIVNFANYDNNGDGSVDGIIMIHSGREAAISLNPLDIWSHAWSITPQVRDGVWISNYCTVAEYRYSSSPNDNTIGVLCHEFGHILGLPDLYDYGNDSYGLGDWSLMAYGDWNGNRGGGDTRSGKSPAFLDAYSRVFLGFVAPRNVTCTISNAPIWAVQDSAMVYRLWTMGNIGPEYYLVEYRPELFTDTALAAPGVTIYHVDEAQPDNNSQWWPGQPPASHYKVALEQADNFFDLEHKNNRMDIGDPYPGSASNTFFWDTSSPSARDYFGNATSVVVGNIQMISANVAVAWLDPGTWDPAPPYPPGEIGPSGMSNLDLQHFEWTWVEHYLYRLQIDSSAYFTSPIFYDSMLTLEYYDFSFAGYPDDYYCWRVSARSYCEEGGWSEGECFLLDRQPPYGSTASSPASTDSTWFQVSWTAGYDPAPSSDIRWWSVYCDSGGPVWPWLTHVDYQSAIFTGARDGKTYRFYTLALDRAGNWEIWDGHFECATQVGEVGGCAYIPGDVNGSGSFDGIDVGMAVNFFKGATLPPAAVRCPPCSTLGLNMYYPEGDANGTCNFDGIDIGYMVNHFKYWYPPDGPYPTLYCPQCAPAGLNPPTTAIQPSAVPALKMKGRIKTEDR